MTHTDVRPVFLPLTLVLACLAPLGCRPAPSPADPEKGREALRIALAAWQNGDSPESLRRGSPPVTATDPKWRDGYRLLRYEIADDARVAGYDLQCRAALWLRGPDGKPTQEKAVFIVSTRPALVVVRAEE
jgi:hypothetical protein